MRNTGIPEYPYGFPNLTNSEEMVEGDFIRPVVEDDGIRSGDGKKKGLADGSVCSGATSGDYRADIPKEKLVSLCI